MRQSFIKCLIQLAISDERIVLLTGDLGYSVLESFRDRFPNRFFNVGVAEQNMVGVATGLAEAGLLPFVYSIATFASLRAYEFIRNGPILHRLPVRIVGTGGGFEYGHCGLTHHGLEDVGVMRIQKGITVVVPADRQQAETALRSTWNLSGPIYYRVGKDENTIVPCLDGRFELGRAHTICEGKDILFVVMGSIASDVVCSVTTLKDRGVNCKVMVVAGMNPSPIDDLLVALRRYRLVISVETHYSVGGLGSLLAEIIADNGIGCRLIRCGVDSIPDGISGSQAYFHAKLGLSPAHLIETVMKEWRVVEEEGLCK